MLPCGDGKRGYNGKTGKTEASATGTSFEIYPAKSFPTTSPPPLSATITIIGNETGGITTFELVVEKDESTTGPVS